MFCINIVTILAEKWIFYRYTWAGSEKECFLYALEEAGNCETDWIVCLW